MPLGRGVFEVLLLKHSGTITLGSHLIDEMDVREREDSRGKEAHHTTRTHDPTLDGKKLPPLGQSLSVT